METYFVILTKVSRRDGGVFECCSLSLNSYPSEEEIHEEMLRLQLIGWKVVYTKVEKRYRLV